MCGKNGKVDYLKDSIYTLTKLIKSRNIYI